MIPPTRILLVSGSTRSGSTNTAALRTAEAVAPEGVTAVVYEGLTDLPPFNPDDDHEPLHPAVAHLRRQIDRADAVVFSTPEYAGTLPGTFKNLLDWTVGGVELYGKPVAWLTVAAEGRGLNAEASLRTVLRYVNAAVLDDACAHLPVARDAIGPDGLVSDAELRGQIRELLAAIARHVRQR